MEKLVNSRTAIQRLAKNRERVKQELIHAERFPIQDSRLPDHQIHNLESRISNPELVYLRPPPSLEAPLPDEF
jgi:hypothetical protein